MIRAQVGFWGLTFVGCFFVVGRAWSAPAALSYTAPSACAPRADFEARVAERGEHFAANASTTLNVSIREANGAYHGSLRIAAPSGESTLREVAGNRCEEVVAALAVVSAIALREDAPNVEPDPATPEPAPVEAKAALPDASAPPAQPVPSVQVPPLRAASSFGAHRSVDVPAGKLGFDVSRSLTLFAGGELGILPSRVLPRFDLSIQVASFVTAPDGKSYLGGVIPRVRLSYFGPSSFQRSGASVDAQGVGAGLGLCWSPLYDTGGFSSLLCAEYGIGLMHFDVQEAALASGGTASNVRSSQSPAFQTGGLGFESEYHVSKAFHIGMKLELDALLQKLSVSDASGNEIFHSSTIAGSGMLGFGVTF